MRFAPLMFLMGPICEKCLTNRQGPKNLFFFSSLPPPSPLPLLCFLFVTVFPQDVFRSSSASLFLLGFMNESVLWQRKRTSPLQHFTGHTHNAALICQVYGCQSLALICMAVFFRLCTCMYICMFATNWACTHMHIYPKLW